jgi:hypothetical protein
MAVQRLLDLRRLHIEAAGDDHLLLAVDDGWLAVPVHPRQVAGMQAAILHCRGRQFRFMPVAGEHIRAADHDLASPSLCDRLAAIIDRPQFRFAEGAPLFMTQNLPPDIVQRWNGIVHAFLADPGSCAVKSNRMVRSPARARSWRSSGASD